MFSLIKYCLYVQPIKFNSLSPNHTRLKIKSIFCLFLIIIGGIAFASSGRQVTFPFTGLQPNQQVMPPDPNEWYRKTNLTKLDNEIAKAEVYFNQGIGENAVNWRFLRRALSRTGVQVNGPEDIFWLNTINGLYSSCNR